VQGGDEDGPNQSAIGRAVPGFGGYFIDRGVPTAYVKDGTDAVVVARALDVPMQQLRVRRADFGYAELANWFSRLSADVLPIPGVTWIDLDESLNRVTVGIERGAPTAASARQAVLDAASRRSVPTAAVVLLDSDPVQLAITLQERVRPVLAGFQISYMTGICSLGVSAYSAGARAFVTASHCTITQGGVESTLFWQPDTSGGTADFIGTEIADPAYFGGGACPLLMICRYSDASLAAYDAAATSAIGKIGRPATINNGNLTIGTPPTFTITAESQNPTPVVGSVLNKVGRTTGWTQGPVSRTCVDISVYPFGYLCQTIVTAQADPGDSGSPVFRITSGTNVRLMGIVSGKIGAEYWYSPWVQVEQELGPLTFTAPPTPYTLLSGLGYAFGLSRNGSVLAVTDYSAGALYKVSTLGGAPTVLANGLTRNGPAGVVVDDASTYWIEVDAASASGTGLIRRISTSGGPITTLASFASMGAPLRSDGTNLYFWANGFIRRIRKVGGQVTSIVESNTADGPAFTIDRGRVYFIDQGSMKWIPIAGGAVTTMTSGVTTGSELLVVGTTLYWANPFTNSCCSEGIFSVATSAVSTAPTTRVLANSLNNLATDGTALYVRGIPGVFRYTLPNFDTVTTLATVGGNGAGFALSVDAQNVYWAHFDQVLRTAKLWP
jgi:hypothetical protein